MAQEIKCSNCKNYEAIREKPESTCERIWFRVEYRYIDGLVGKRPFFEVLLDGKTVYNAKDERDMSLFGAELRAKIGAK